MNPKTHHSRKPDHTRLMPYSRQQSKQDLAIMVRDYFRGNTMQPRENHPLLFCAGLEVCFYATQDCLYKKKKCYYE